MFALPSAIALALLALAVAPSRSEAGFVPVFLSSAVNGTQVNYNYTLNFTSNGSTESLSNGDFITLYDIGQASIVAPGLTVTQNSMGTTAPGTGPMDDPNVLNVTFTYTGATITADTTFVGIVITSPYQLRIGQYSSTDSIALGKNGQIGPVQLPSPTAVPEPGSLALLGLGAVAGLLGVARRRRPA